MCSNNKYKDILAGEIAERQFYKDTDSSTTHHYGRDRVRGIEKHALYFYARENQASVTDTVPDR